MKDATRVKILILGESSVGKSSLLTQYIENKFMPTHMPTIGVEYKQKLITTDDQSLVKVQIWDTAGTERFRTITPIYYRNVDGVLLVFDITDAESFETISYWVGELNDKADIASIQLLLIGNKNDLNHAREVTSEKAEETAKSIGIDYLETSAKNHDSTEIAFNKLIERILKQKKKCGGKTTTDNIKLTNVELTSADKKKQKGSECC